MTNNKIPSFLAEIYCGRGKNIKVSELQDTTLYAIIEDIMSSKHIEGKVIQVRNIQDTQQRQDAKKALLPYFVLNKFKSNYRSNNNFLEAKYIVADFDHISERYQEISDKLRADPRVLLFFTSPSKDGIKIIFPLSTPITDGSFFSTYYVDVITKISKEYGVTPDLSCKDPARAIFMSHDPSPFINEHSTPLPVSTPSTGTLRGRPPKQNIESSMSSAILDLFKPVGPGERTHQMTQVVGLCINQGFTIEVTLPITRLVNAQNTPPHDDKKVVDTVKDMYARYKKEKLPFDIIERDNQYFRVTFGEKEKLRSLTSFIIRPKELLVSDADVLRCDVISSDGVTYPELLLEVKDWTAESLHNSIGHMDCTVHGTDTEIKVLKRYINSRIPVRKHGTRVVGLDDSCELWVTKNCNINKDGILTGTSMTSIPYDRGGDAFYNKIEYLFQEDDEYLKNIKKFYDLILKLNEPQAIIPFIGWNFIAPMRKKIMEYKKKFPVLFVPGGQGSGKTSTAQIFMRLHGYLKDDIQHADMRRFPMLKALSATNGIPIFIDEFKEGDMTDITINDIHRYIRKSTDGGVEPKGHADQTTTDYHLLAPWGLLGEWSIKTPAERERMIIPRFSSEIKVDTDMQKVYKELTEKTELRGFMPKYMQWLLNQDMKARYDTSYLYCENHFKEMSIAPRVLHNLVVMTTGINLFIDYAVYLGIPKPTINIPVILNGQLLEITGTPTGQVQSAIDQLLEEMSQMSIREKRDTSGLATGNTREPWYMVYDHQGRAALAIRFSLALPMVKEFVRKVNSDIDILDAMGYKRMLNPKEVKYLISASHPVRIGSRLYRCVSFDIEKMKLAGVDIEGFEDN